MFALLSGQILDEDQLIIRNKIGKKQKNLSPKSVEYLLVFYKNSNQGSINEA